MHRVNKALSHLNFQEDTMAELEKLHSEQELNIMEVFHNVEKTMEKIEDGCKFADNVIEQGNTIEVRIDKHAFPFIQALLLMKGGCLCQEAVFCQMPTLSINLLGNSDAG